MSDCTFEIEAANPAIDQLKFNDDFTGASFRVVPMAGGCGARIHVSAFELAGMITRLSELHLFLQSKFLESKLGAPSAPLKVDGYQVDPSQSGKSVTLRFLPKGEGTTSLGYRMPPDMARKVAHELLAAADTADRQQPLVAN
jgi:hypothetical protein